MTMTPIPDVKLTARAAMLSAVPDMIFLISRKGVYLDFKPGKKARPFVPPDGFLGKHYREVLPPAMCAEAAVLFSRLEESGESVHHSYSLPNPDDPGTLDHFEATYSLAGENFVVIVHDVTRLKNTQESLEQSRAQLESFVRHTPAAIAMFDRELCYISYSDRWLEDYGLGDRDLRGLHHYDVFPEIRALPRWVDIHNRCLAGATERCDEDSFDREDGGKEWLRWEVRPWYETDGDIGGVIMLTEVITARKRAEEELIKAKREAEEANRAKSDFLSRMSHELRTPLNAILGFAQMLDLDREELKELHRENVDHILSSGNHLLNLINEVLDIARAESGLMDLYVKKIEIDETLRNVSAMMRPLAEKRGIVLAKTPSESHSIYGDEQRLKQILLNLVSNAVKYNRENGRVEISVSLTSDAYVRISIHDTGIGIPEADRADIFEPFKRAREVEGKLEGTGIGLTITRKLTELMQGRLGFESEYGKGSCFWAEFPSA